MAEAGPSRPRPRPAIRKLRPSAPPAPARAPQRTLPLKVLQGAGTQRTDNTRPGFARDTLFVTRKTKLGALIGRARRLVLDEGYTHLTLYALSAAIPHALLLLHALMDVLPFPSGPGGMWYEIATDTVECVDELDADAGGDTTGDGGAAEGEDVDLEFAGLGAVEEDAPVLQTRNKSSIRIDLHVAPCSKSVYASETGSETGSGTGSGTGRKRKNGKARPSAKRRRAMKSTSAAANEEDMMNA